MKQIRRFFIICSVFAVGFLCPLFLWASEPATKTQNKSDGQADIFKNSQKTSTDFDSSPNPKKTLSSGSFVLETDESTASESLNRISGDIDKGFSAPENTFKSPDHYGVGPFAKEKSEMDKNGNSSY